MSSAAEQPPPLYFIGMILPFAEIEGPCRYSIALEIHRPGFAAFHEGSGIEDEIAFLFPNESQKGF